MPTDTVSNSGFDRIANTVEALHHCLELQRLLRLRNPDVKTPFSAGLATLAEMLALELAEWGRNQTSAGGCPVGLLNCRDSAIE